jgi:hypothetical protein
MAVRASMARYDSFVFVVFLRHSWHCRQVQQYLTGYFKHGTKDATSPPANTGKPHIPKDGPRR